MHHDIARTSLAALGLEDRLRVLDQPAPTALAAAEQLDCPVGAIANSIVFDVEGQPLLVMVSGAHRANIDTLSTLVDKRTVKRASRRFVARTTNQDAGGVAPFGHPQPITTFIDRNLTNYDTIWAGAGTETTMFHTTATELATITSGQLVDLI